MREKHLQGRDGIKAGLPAVSRLRSFIKFTGAQSHCSGQTKRSPSHVSQRPGWRRIPAFLCTDVKVWQQLQVRQPPDVVKHPISRAVVQRIPRRSMKVFDRNAKGPNISVCTQCPNAFRVLAWTGREAFGRQSCAIQDSATASPLQLNSPEAKTESL